MLLFLLFHPEFNSPSSRCDVCRDEAYGANRCDACKALTCAYCLEIDPTTERVAAPKGSYHSHCNLCLGCRHMLATGEDAQNVGGAR